MTTHGHTASGVVTAVYQAWRNMRSRCLNPNHPQWPNYGGRGITICPEWDRFEAFYKDMCDRPGPGYSLDRADNNGPYDSSNCRWATWDVQLANSRHTKTLTLSGETMILAAWARRYNLDPQVLAMRIQRGWPPERALTGPVRTRTPRPAAVGEPEPTCLGPDPSGDPTSGGDPAELLFTG